MAHEIFKGAHHSRMNRQNALSFLDNHGDQIVRPSAANFRTLLKCQTLYCQPYTPYRDPISGTDSCPGHSEVDQNTEFLSSHIEDTSIERQNQTLQNPGGRRSTRWHLRKTGRHTTIQERIVMKEQTKSGNSWHVVYRRTTATFVSQEWIKKRIAQALTTDKFENAHPEKPEPFSHEVQFEVPWTEVPFFAKRT